MEVNLSSKPNIERKIGILDWGIIFAVLVLFTSIFVPAIIWKEEDVFRSDSRFRMHVIADAEKFYYELLDEYTADGAELFRVIEAAADSLIADSLFTDDQIIKLGEKMYHVNMNRGFDLRVDTTFTHSQKLQRTYEDTMYLISKSDPDPEASTAIQKWVNIDDIDTFKSDTLFLSIDSMKVESRIEKYTDYMRKRFHLTTDLLNCPLTGNPYILEIDKSDSSYHRFIVKSPVPEDYSEPRFGIFKFKSGNHGFINDGVVSWAERD